MNLEEMPLELQEELTKMTPDMGLGNNDDMSNCPQQ
jgi:hypothetical protein